MKDLENDLKLFSSVEKAVRDKADEIQEFSKQFSESAVQTEDGAAKAREIKRIIDREIDERGVIDNSPTIPNGCVIYRDVPYANLSADVLQNVLDYCFSIEIDPSLNGTTDIIFNVKNMWKIPDNTEAAE